MNLLTMADMQQIDVINKGINGADLGIPSEKKVFSGPTSYAMESSGWYCEKNEETLRDVETICGKEVQESKQNVA